MSIRIISIAFLSLAFAFGTQAQHKGKRTEKIKAFRVAIFTEVLDLSVEEAQKFWPLYNEFEAKREALKKEYKPARNTEGLSDAELEASLNRFFELEQKQLDLKKAYMERFKKILPLQKVVRLPRAEKRFREALLKRMAEHKRNRE